MGNRAHTKGPWSLGEPPYHTDVFGADGFSVAEAGSVACLHRDYYAGRMGDDHWATTPGSHIDRDEAQLEANARLIAAAPDMFEALKCLPIGWLSAGILSHSDSDILMIKMQVTGTVYEHEISVGQLRAAAAALSKASEEVDHG